MTRNPPQTAHKAAVGGTTAGAGGLGVGALVYAGLIELGAGELLAGLGAAMISAGVGFALTWIAPRNRDKDGWGRYGS